MMRYGWARPGDVNGFFGLLLDNAAALVLLFTLVSSYSTRPDRFTTWFVLERMIPGTVAGVLLLGLLYVLLAFRLARRSGRGDVTAMPMGVDTPTVIAVALFVLLPALKEGQELHGLGHDDASVYAWNVAMLVTVMVGLFKLLCAPLGNALRRLLPRAASLGSLAAISLALIAFLPLSRDVAAVPLVGIPTLLIILITLLARQGLPGRFPGTVVALAVGYAIYFICFLLQERFGLELVELPGSTLLRRPETFPPMPESMWEVGWWSHVWAGALPRLPILLPFGLATVIGGLECTESAAAGGDEYDTRSVLLAQGLGTVTGGLLGGVVQNTPYFGHPAYKTMGARSAYVLGAALVLGLAGYFGWFVHLFDTFPPVVLFPVILFIGLQTIAHSVQSTPAKHYSAVALAALPVLAFLADLAVDRALGTRPPDREGAVFVQTMRCLGNGFIITSLLWAGTLTALLDRRPGRATAFLLLAGGCALVGLIHSPLPDAPLSWPPHSQSVLSGLYSQPLDDYLAGHPEGRYQTPWHWAGAYLLAALVVLAYAPFTRSARNGQDSSLASPQR